MKLNPWAALIALLVYIGAPLIVAACIVMLLIGGLK